SRARRGRRTPPPKRRNAPSGTTRCKPVVGRAALAYAWRREPAYAHVERGASAARPYERDDVTAVSVARRDHAGGIVARALDNRAGLSALFMFPAAAILLLVLTYPLGLGLWRGVTAAHVGRPGIFIGLENYFSLFDDDIFWLSVFNTIVYTVTATIAKFALGLWLAVLLNQAVPFKALIRAIVLLPYIVPTVLSAIAFWWIYDPQFSIISWALTRLGLIHQYIDFLGMPWHARWSLI